MRRCVEEGDDQTDLVILQDDSRLHFVRQFTGVVFLESIQSGWLVTIHALHTIKK